FDTTYFQVPGRMNIFTEHPFDVILDYGHNPAAIDAMVQLVQRMDPSGRKLLVLAAPGDRRDEDIKEIGRICAGNFDHYICRRDDSLRGRAADEVPALLRAALLEHGVPEEQIEIIEDEAEAVDAVLAKAQTDDLALIFGDRIARCWEQITEFHCDTEIPRGDSTTRTDPPETSLAPDLDLHNQSLVHDDRGVHLARQDDEESD
ncbi:MAG: cyanophycin synthetase, partial [Planctomycetota bacterium]|nr:cyanophycin synthetase [Planctomycetota bacterium]